MALAIKHSTRTTSGDSGVQELSSLQVRENNGTPGVATVLIREGGSGNAIRIPIELAANESQVLTFDHPLVASAGTATWYVDIAAGTCEVVLSGRT